MRKKAPPAAPRPERFALWLEHAMPVAIFRRTLTQWYVGFGGRTGLRYSAARLVYDALSGRPEHWPETLEELQVLELAALEVWAEAKPQE